MSIFRYFFQKRNATISNERVLQEQRQRFNPLRGFDPDKLVNAIDAFRVGTIEPLSRIIEELEERDDMMMSCARKNRASLGRCRHQVLIVEGFENDPRAELHKKILTRFWANIEVTSTFMRNERGGIRLLKQHMANAISRRYAVHEIVWQPLPDGEITARFIHVPNWFFENRTGELRFLQSPGMIDGVSMTPGEWLVTMGDGIGIAAAVLAMSKVLSRNDWLLFSERCGQPGLHVKTDAAEGSEPWKRVVSAVRNFGREWSLVTDNATSLSAIDLKTGSQLPYEPLINMCNKGIVTLYRGADLSTISGQDAQSTGASVQGKESDLLEQDACEMLSETLNAQVERFVIRYVTGDNQPLAYLSIAPTEQPNIDQDIKIDTHLAAHGVELSRNDALARYARAAYDPANKNDVPLKPVQTSQNQLSGSYGYANERKITATPLQNAAIPLQNARTEKDGAMDGSEKQALKTASGAIPAAMMEAAALDALAEARAASLAPVIDRLLDALAETDDNAMRTTLESLYRDLPRLAEVAAASSDTVALLERILSDAVGAGWREGQGIVGTAHELANAAADRTQDGQFATKGTGDQTSQGGYTEEHQKQIGQSGDWKKLGLPAGRDIPADAPTPKTGIAEARARLQQGETAKTPLGDTLAFDETTRKHLYREKGNKPRKQEDVNKRLQALDQARAAIEKPHEIWRDESNGRNIYVRFEAQARGREVINAVDADSTHVYSWHTNDTSFDHYRKGRLLYVRK